MRPFELLYVSNEDVERRGHYARQTTLLLRFDPPGKCLGIYQSPKAIKDGNWSVTQGGINPGETRYHVHGSMIAAMRELAEELGVVQDITDFAYLGSVLGCVSRNRTIDYHVVGCIARDRHVTPNPEEVAAFRWESVPGCMEALKVEGFMSKQKSEIVSRALLQVAGTWQGLTESRFAEVLSSAQWPTTILFDRYSQTAA